MQNENQPVNPGEPKHPRDEEWMEWLYDETSPTDKARLTEHLKQCGQCRAAVQRWERTRQALDLGKIETPRAPDRLNLSWVKWGIAAVFLLVVGFSIGQGKAARSAALPGMALGEAQMREIRSSLKAELSAELVRQLADYKKDTEQKNARDNKWIMDALARTDNDRVADYAQLHKELETVAVLTQNSFQQTQQQIVTLANYSQPENKN